MSQNWKLYQTRLFEPTTVLMIPQSTCLLPTMQNFRQKFLLNFQKSKKNRWAVTSHSSACNSSIFSLSTLQLEATQRSDKAFFPFLELFPPNRPISASHLQFGTEFEIKREKNRKMRARTQFIEDLVKFYGKRAGLTLDEIQVSFFVTKAGVFMILTIFWKF